MKQIWKKKLSIIFLSLLLGLTISHSIAAEENPIEMLQNVTQRVMNELRAHDRDDLRRHPNKLYSLVNHLILPHVDFYEMAKWVVGRNAWTLADNQTRDAFIKEFKTLVVRTYANSLLEYTDQKVEFLPMRESFSGKKRIQVQSLIKEQGRSPLHMDYNLIREENDWKVYDIIIEGVSLVQGYRAQFSDDIQQGGLTVAIEKMRKRNSEGQ